MRDGHRRRTARSVVGRFVRLLPRRVGNRLRGVVERLHISWIRRFRRYGPADLAVCLRSLGVREGDTLMVHSSFPATSGFTGKPGDVIDALREVIGTGGHIMMVSLPYTGATVDHLERGLVFDVRRTPSRMGIVSEFFRRRPGVLRSLHPSHPILVEGPEAGAMVRGHEEALFPCGPGSPFQAGMDRDGKIVLLDAPLSTMTLFHWLEHELRERLPFPLYHEPAYEAMVVDAAGERRTVRTLAFSREAIRRRRDNVLHREMWRRGVVARGRVGNSTVLVCRMREVAACALDMADRGVFFYDMD
ncbi:MAG: AAC(3) family N-acetyltransferase [Longimicrobiales bacterium]|nr:AAC(3) family N-acetyltransferase [Longimicrobiales bacterium]